MKRILIFCLLLLSRIVAAQSIVLDNPSTLFAGYDTFCMSNYEEGVIYTWRWKDNGYVMMSAGGLTDLVVPQNYKRHNHYF